MKNFQKYFFEANKIYEFRIKVAGVELNKETQDRIKNALEAFKVETMSTPKRLPIQEHRDFPKVGPCECYTIDVGVCYPTIAPQIRQLIIERCAINADCVCVYPKDQYEDNETFESYGKDHDGSLLDVTELKDDPSGQELVGNGRLTSLIKELSDATRKFEVAGSDTTVGGEKDPSYGKTTNDVPAGNNSPVGSSQNKIPSPVKGK